jgi:hypothetical protein
MPNFIAEIPNAKVQMSKKVSNRKFKRKATSVD